MKKILTLIAFVIIASVTLNAQNARQEFMDSLISDHKVVQFGKGPDVSTDSIRTLLDHFYYDQFRNFQDPAAPYFLFLSRDTNLAMGIGGMVRMRGYYDWGGVTSSGFSPYSIPTSKDPLNDRLLGTTPSGTALFFRIIGRNKSVGDYQLYIEGNFKGYGGRDFHLKKAYAILNDWTIGYASSTFGDGSAEPPTVDASGPTMKMSATAVLVRYMHTFKNGIVVAGSVETPSMSIETPDNGSVAARSQYIPNVAAFVQYEWSHNEHIRLSAIGRVLPYRDMLNGKNYNPMGYGVELSTVFSPTYALTVYGMFNVGKSYSNFGGDFMLGKYDLVEDLATPGRLHTSPGFGYYLGVQYNFTPSLFTSVTFGQGRYLPSYEVDGSNYKYGLYGAVNLFWNLTQRIQVGAEYNFGKRANFDGSHGFAQRVGALAAFSF